MNQNVRVRFAPSPTGPLHIGGVRTALYNYLFARKMGGKFLLRLEDTDQTRFVAGAEQYIIDSLLWLGISPDEGVSFGGDLGPYKQSDRREIYKKYADQLLAEGKAYYAFDTSEELEAKRAEDATFKYDSKSRLALNNSLTLSKEEVEIRIKDGDNVALRLLIPSGQSITFYDTIRGEVSFSTDELDDKVIMKGDGLPTYHFANIVDDHLMEITHVIRGEEWLSSTAHHVLMYSYFGWQPPVFAHLPLILKPTGKGKLSKRDGAKFGFPVFPLSWNSDTEDDSFIGFREDGYLPEAVINFLALLGWSPGNDQEVFSLEELVEAFSIDKIVKHGARFDIDKALWFNQKYIINTSNEELARIVRPHLDATGLDVTDAYLAAVCGQMKPRVHKLTEIIRDGQFFFIAPTDFDKETIGKKYKAESSNHFLAVAEKISLIGDATAALIEASIKEYVSDHQLKMGEIFPILRIALSGSVQGPDLMETIAILGTKESANRIIKGVEVFNNL